MQNFAINPVVGRFAPSPTGPLHLGSLVAALGSYILARRTGGRWLLRMEDLDRLRVVPGAAEDMLLTLELLGFEWDGEVIYQSRRDAAYHAALDRLIAQGSAYPCGCSRAEIAQIASAPHDSEQGVIYPGLCRAGMPAGKVARAVRVQVPDELVVFHDGIMGSYGQSLKKECGDFVVQRADGPFAYHLAVVVDDAESGVNQVVRGADLLPSTPRQIYLQRLLGYQTPTYNHLPLVVDPQGGKLSKRHNAVSLAAGMDFNRSGHSLLLAALKFLGQSPPPVLEGAPCREIMAWSIAHADPLLIPIEPAPISPASQEAPSANDNNNGS